MITESLNNRKIVVFPDFVTSMHDFDVHWLSEADLLKRHGIPLYYIKEVITGNDYLKYDEKEYVVLKVKYKGDYIQYVK